jgi:hypothetical protein
MLAQEKLSRTNPQSYPSTVSTFLFPVNEGRDKTNAPAAAASAPPASGVVSASPVLLAEMD